MSDKMKEWMKSRQALKLLDQGVNVAEQENVVDEQSRSTRYHDVLRWSSGGSTPVQGKSTREGADGQHWPG
jgi:antibiotic biosynthesis monooxygenase (ABM) superfamily enzyme